MTADIFSNIVFFLIIISVSKSPVKLVGSLTTTKKKMTHKYVYKYKNAKDKFVVDCGIVLFISFYTGDGENILRPLQELMRHFVKI